MTSASLMSRRPAAREAAEETRRHPGLAIGLHLDLDDVAAEGRALEQACGEQLEAFRSMLGRGPTHLDSHHHVHMSEPASAVVRRIAERLGVPLRGHGIRYEGRFYGRSDDGRTQPDRVSLGALLRLIEALPDGWTELGCHPGRGVGGESSYAAEREWELATLCDPRARAAAERAGIGLRSFADV